ncbi:helicase-exonuclease AddAB subunit AddB [Paenibacillus agilis]|uniref:ATP-dependent helicase/deoxyribonuclease subunit B n=1 Tax=Paenibacillus agilis TaxID=3020863 RepID=A0A559J347_9BACL|nr:helicase-exonuclease AddAB subunit AddB [Paenibacillus agilis]TVX94307.1 helicase-exonuclease AddAB subunit AddB [Paenibacillus agilis]
MALTFIIGRSGSGKTTHILDQIREQVIQQPEGPPIILLVPEQGTFQLEHELVKTEGLHGLLRAQVLSFRRLAYRVMQETGGTALTPINEEGKKMLLYRIMQQKKSNLSLFSGTAEQFGFIEKLNSLFDEMKRYRIQSSDVEEQLSWLTGGSGHPLLAAKLRDITEVMREFEIELSQHYLDGEDVLMRLAESVPQSSYVRDAQIWIDGFHGFTPQELSVLAALMLQSKDVRIALTLDRPYEQGQTPHELNLFHPTATTYIQLREIADTLQVPIGDLVQLDGRAIGSLLRFKESPLLSHLEKHYERRTAWQDSTVTQKEQQAVTVHAAVNRRVEVEAAVRDMLSRVRNGEARWRDMAVVVRNIGDYSALIDTVFTDFDIPYFKDQKSGVLHHPFVEMTRAALDIWIGFWKPDAVFRFIKTDFVLPEDGSITRLDMDRFENYVLAAGIEGRRWVSKRPWPKVPSLSLDADNSSEEETGAPALIEQCRQLIAVPLMALERGLSRASDVRDMCEALYRFWMDLGVPHRLERMSAEAMLNGDVQRSREHRQIWDAVLSILDQLVEMAGNETITLELFAGMLETGFESVKLALVPPALDQVLIASMDRTRTGQIKHAYLLGANDGIIPARPIEDGVLTENERDVLLDTGMQLAPGVRRQLLDERFLIYNALTAASHTLWVSYALADEEGKSLLPSEVIRQIRQLFPHVEEQLELAEPNEFMDDLEQLRYVAHPEMALRHLISQLREWRRGVAISPVWWDVYHWLRAQPSWQHRLRTLTGSLLYRNQVQPLDKNTSRKLYGSKLRTSVSRMERFVACPFSHFASHGLKLRQRQLYRLEAPDIGQLFHAALSQFANDLKSNQRSWAALTADESRAEADRIVDLLSPRLQGEILMSTNRYKHISRKLKQIVAKAADIIGQHAKRGEFEPLALEIDFGPDKPLPPLQFTLDNGCTMEIIGRIDRVDCADSEQGILLRVIDYKSSSTDLKLHEVYYGLSLQMLTYLDVLLTHAEEWIGQTALPAGALYFHVHNPLLAATNGMAPDLANEQLMKKFKMKGLVLADREVVAKMDAPLEKGYSDILPVAVKQDGSFYSNASVATTEQWDVLRDNVRNVIQRIGTHITDGEVQIEPYRMGPSKACDYCDYKPVCQFDELLEGNQYRMLPRMSKDDVWMQLQGGGESSHGSNK